MPIKSHEGHKKKPSVQKLPSTGKVKKENSFPIVAIGASSGGLEAMTELLKYLPSDTGMAFIFIQHLSPDYKSLLASLLTKTTKMKVQEIEKMEKIKPDNVYVVPYNKGIEVIDGHIQLIPRQKSSTNQSIDVLFTSLAETHKENTIGVVLSGNASDGTIGLEAIKQQGGITFAQDNSAKYGSMPESAISAGIADFILSPKEIAQELSRISKHAYKRSNVLQVGNENKISDNHPDLKIILQLLYKEAGADFSHYKMNTIKRRILRRMFLYKLKTLKQYKNLLKVKSAEVEVLYNDLLINVTDFFREPQTFKYLKTVLFPKLLKSKMPNEPLRIWVAGCSTGQEAYSIAMIIIEIFGNKSPGKQVQIFATDLSEQAIKKARTGEYTKQEIQSVSPKRLDRFFAKIDGNYRIIKSVRDLCAFAPHNILSDPPFSKMDFISCCNLFIYLDTVTHKKALSTFHYALNDGGCLMLGNSETTGSSKLFSHINGKFKIYSRKKGLRTLPDLTLGQRQDITKKKVQLHKKIINANNNSTATDAAINSIIFSRYIPAYVVINYAMEVLQFKGATSNYLEHSTGKATLNLLNMARPEIAFELRNAIYKAIETKHEIHKSGIEIKNGVELRMITLDIIPLKAEEEPLLLVVFSGQQTEWNEPHLKSQKNISAVTNSSLNKLKEELAVVRAELISTIEEKEKVNKILQATNEDILSSNEEFQSMNEELETSKEEIESANEELITTNQELQTRNELLAEAYDFSEAIISTLHEPILVLDKEFRVKSANKAFFNKFRVLQIDTEGKPVFELGNHQWDIPRLRELLEKMLQKNSHFEDYEITHAFPRIGKKTMLLNARRVVQKVQHEQLILLAFTDITERTKKRKAEKKKLEDIIRKRTSALQHSYKELGDKNISLEKMNKELETFTFISSHDLQEPLRKIKNFANVLVKEEQKKLSDNGRDYLQRMIETVKRMQTLIDDLLAYSRVTNAERKFEKINLTEIAEEVIADFKEIIKEKKAVIELNELCIVNTIQFQFRQLIHNLIGNALKFSRDKIPPHIIIKSETAMGSQLNNDNLLPETEYCHLTVFDNGIGFDPQYKERIFEVFQRLHEYDQYIGTGMGLAICKRIVENHNGIITAKGKINKGAQFDIYIPTS